MGPSDPVAVPAAAVPRLDSLFHPDVVAVDLRLTVDPDALPEDQDALPGDLETLPGDAPRGGPR